MARMPIEERFWSKVDKTSTCWEWTGAKVHNGYGVFSLPGNKQQVAHKFSFRLALGEVPEKMELDHTCHNRACVRPDHLRLATHKQNQENRTGAQTNAASGVRGVHRNGDKWRGAVRHNKKTYSAGRFADIESAARAVEALRLKLFTHNDLDRVA